MLPATLTAQLRIAALVDQAVGLGDRPGAANAGAKVMTLIAARALGADSIEDCDVLRSGRTAALLGHGVNTPSTLGTSYGLKSAQETVQGLFASSGRLGGAGGSAPSSSPARQRIARAALMGLTDAPTLLYCRALVPAT